MPDGRSVWSCSPESRRVVRAAIAAQPAAHFTADHVLALRGGGTGPDEADLVIAHQSNTVAPVWERTHAVACPRGQGAVGHRVTDAAQHGVLEVGGTPSQDSPPLTGAFNFSSP